MKCYIDYHLFLGLKKQTNNDNNNIIIINNSDRIKLLCAYLESVEVFKCGNNLFLTLAGDY